MSPRLELVDVRKRYEGGVEAVRGVSMALQPGEFLSLLGPSGCGKSTTLSMIAGFESPTGGAIRLDGADLQLTPPGRRGIGMVFQDYAVFGRLSVLQNLSFGLEAQNCPAAERHQRMAAIAGKLDLAPLFPRLGASLNMSEMQRVALGRVLVTNPRLLLLDEPMSNLDAALRMTLRGELKAIQRSLGQSILYVTHDQAEAMSMSDRIAVMRDGSIEQIGTPQEIYRHPATRFVAEFIGDPPINLIPCSIMRSGSTVAAVTALHRGVNLQACDAAEGEQILAVRPHDLYLTKSEVPGSAKGSVRFVERLGAEDVVHVEYGDDLVAAISAPGFANAGEALWLRIDGSQAHVIWRDNGQIARREGVT